MGNVANPIVERFVMAQSIVVLRSMIADRHITNVDAQDRDVCGSRTALMSQCMWRRLDSVHFLLAECNPPANPNLRNDIGQTALHLACVDGGGGDDCPELIKLLLDYGADRNIKSNSGETALDIAIDTGFKQSIDLLQNYFPTLIGREAMVIPTAYAYHVEQPVSGNNASQSINMKNASSDKKVYNV